MRRADDDTDNPDHHLYRQGDTWYLKVEIGGKQLRESLRTKDIEAARATRDTRLAELRGETHSWPVAVGKWIAEYLPDNVDDSTAERYQVSIAQIAPALVTYRGRKNVPLESVPVEHITLRTIGEIVSWSKKARPLITHATLRRDLTALSSLLKATVSWAWRDDNPAKTWDRSHIKERRPPIVLPRPDHLASYLAACTPMWAAAMRFLDACGMREMEAFRLEWFEIEPDLSGAQLTDTKTNAPRFVPFDRTAAGILAGIPRHLKSKLVFWHGDGRPYRNVSSRHAAIRKLPAVTAAAGGEVTFRVHDLRHSYAVRYLRNGGSIYDLQKILGHASIKTTELYLDYLSPEQQKVAKRIVAGSA